MDKKQFMEMCKALSNETRVNILIWLKDPEKHFPGKKLHLSPDTADCPGGICVGSIQDKAGISQSTISHYLDMLQRAGLLSTERVGRWTYYRRNEQALQELSRFIGQDLWPDDFSQKRASARRRYRASASRRFYFVIIFSAAKPC